MSENNTFFGVIVILPDRLKFTPLGSIQATPMGFLVSLFAGIYFKLFHYDY